MKASKIAAAVALTAGALGTLGLTGTASAVDNPCPTPSRIDTGSAGNKTFTLCSYNPGQGAIFKDVYLSVDGGANQFVGSAIRDGITRGFVVASETTLALRSTAGDECQVQSSFDGGATWTKTLAATDGGEPTDLTFTDASNGAVTCDNAGTITKYSTTDGGHTWTQVA